MRFDMDHSTAQVAANLRFARAGSGLSLRGLARRVGTSHSALSAYEHGRKVPSAANYLRILEACGFGEALNRERRIREADGIERGEELRRVLDLAEEFPRGSIAPLRRPPWPAS